MDTLNTNFKIIKKIGDRGQVTIPIEVRELLNIADGDILEFEIIAIHPKKAAIE
jgi:AbrB family looped-hinge helix DNA binding protein